jgi:hypothetical protein
MNTLFKRLPTALQWEILCIFVGTHVVRFNKLRRRLDGKVQKEILMNTMHLSDERRLFLKPVPIYNPDKIPWLGKYRTVSIIKFTEGSKRMLMENSLTGQLSSWYISNSRWIEVILDDILVLPPFEKHTYPSWESTDKKKKIIWQKVVLYDPCRTYAESYGNGSDWFCEFD